MSLALKDTEQELKAAKAALKTVKPLRSSELEVVQELLKDADAFLQEVSNAVKDLKDIAAEVSELDDPDAALDLAQEAGEIADNVSGISKDIEERISEAIEAQKAEDASAAEEEAAAKKAAEEEAAAKKAAEEEAAAKKAAEEEAAAKKAAEEEAAAKKAAEEEAAAKKAAEEEERRAKALLDAQEAAAEVLQGANRQFDNALSQLEQWAGEVVQLDETADLVAQLVEQVSDVKEQHELSRFESAIHDASSPEQVDAVIQDIEASALAVEGVVDAARPWCPRLRQLFVKSRRHRQKPLRNKRRKKPQLPP